MITEGELIEMEKRARALRDHYCDHGWLETQVADDALRLVEQLRRCGQVAA